MGLFSTKTTEEKLLNELSEEAKKKYFSYTEERKEEILELYKKSPSRQEETRFTRFKNLPDF